MNVVKAKTAGILTIGALAAIFTGCATKTAADLCLENMAHSEPYTPYNMQSVDIEKYKKDCAKNRSDFLFYRDVRFLPRFRID